MSDITLMTRVVQADPADEVAVMALADAIAERTGDHDAARAAARLARAQGLIVSLSSGRIRGALCRLTGATRRDGRPISTVSYTVVAGDAAPSYEGASYHYETPGGAIVRHPNAYRRAYGRPVYCPAYHEITVGADWLLARADELKGGA